ncbi:MAG TPA: Rieske 2Fe-2S domain-containing protein [Verrucomicrobiae bacterium]|jgi:5,5'-dehydrodivanillate O-demethylase|nr:Rieske 2Fe-2S domain-containing protein [Verrucomicrobiae bacterium]
MLTREENILLTSVGAGTPVGELLRRYWQPVAPAAELHGLGRYGLPKSKRLKILDEDLILFRDDQGHYGLLGDRCPHRGASLSYGFVEDGGIRCPYHGYLFDSGGRCLEQPDELPDSKARRIAKHKAYRVEKLAGLLFAYMGPSPAPLLPRWNVLVRQDGRRKIVVHPVLNCNWLNAQENSVDPVHTRWLHAHIAELKGLPGGAYYSRPITKLEFEEVRSAQWAGIIKRRSYGGSSPEDEVGHPLIFPNMLLAPQRQNWTFHWRVPIDDTHTQIFWLEFSPSHNGHESTDEPDVEYPDFKDESGEFNLKSFPSQDAMAWETQGERGEYRLTENLGAIDRGIEMFRKMLFEQIEVVKKGGEPIGLVRDRAKNEIIEFQLSTGQAHFATAAA